MEKKVLTSGEIKDFIQKHLGFTYVEDIDDLRSDLRLGDARIDQLVAACNTEFGVSISKVGIHKVKGLIRRIKDAVAAKE